MTALCSRQLERHYDSWRSGNPKPPGKRGSYSTDTFNDFEKFRRYYNDLSPSSDEGVLYMQELARKLLTKWDGERSLDKPMLCELLLLLVERDYGKR